MLITAEYNTFLHIIFKHIALLGIQYCRVNSGQITVERLLINLKQGKSEK
jgi:hypothetical protein